MKKIRTLEKNDNRKEIQQLKKAIILKGLELNVNTKLLNKYIRRVHNIGVLNYVIGRNIMRTFTREALSNCNN